jgi:hypothetical protein
MHTRNLEVMPNNVQVMGNIVMDKISGFHVLKIYVIMKQCSLVWWYLPMRLHDVITQDYKMYTSRHYTDK